MPTDPGVYIFLDDKGDVLYVGKAKNIKKRVSSYFVNRKNLGSKTKVLVDKIHNIKTLRVESEIESLILEANLIKKYNPRYNARLTDGKSYYQIKLTVKESIPKVLLTRREDDLPAGRQGKKSIYFGPFPNSSDLKTVLKLIRRIFPYQSVINHSKKYCLYYHIGLCPCPPMFKSDRESKEYRKNIHHIRQFFEGGTKKIIKELEGERDLLSKSEEFEDAKAVQIKIDAVKLITSSTRTPFEYEMNPNLRSDLRSKETEALKQSLKENGVNVSKLNRIECFDISNISGKFATGSMVVFTNGEKDSASYRRFKIKRPPKVIPNDFAMMQEVLQRRIRHKDWPFPDLIIVDGGKGQVSAVNKIVFEQNINVPVIGIAKREELLITADFKVIRLPRDSDGLNLVKRIRDEAHRFAITYHRKLRSKYFLS